ncbi:MAG: restriction endonuclease [Candidatus Peribacter sp.]|nr:restriction endonuclease [Candidatus Peribacter sp.]
MQDLSPKAFEYFSKYLLETMGYEHVQVSPKHGAFNADGGIDLYAQRNGNLVVGQCKHHSERSGRGGYMKFEYVQALGGAMLKAGAQEGVFVSTLPFSRTSKDYAASVNMRLIGPEEINDVMAQSPEGFSRGKWRVSYGLHRVAKFLGLKQLANELMERILALAFLILLLFLLPHILPALFKVIMWIGSIAAKFSQSHPIQIKMG